MMVGLTAFVDGVATGGASCFANFSRGWGFDFQSNESINLVERVSGGRVIARGESKGSPYPLSVRDFTMKPGARVRVKSRSLDLV